MSTAPRTIGPYTILDELGEGGMAVTWRAREAIAGVGGTRVVALKQIRPEFAHDPEFRRMFLDEARLSSQINHQNICRTYAAGEVDGTLFMAMEFVDGTDLWHLMHQAEKLDGGFPLPHALAICEMILAGLQSAHDLRGDDGQLLNLVHRDISPQNILLSRQGEVKIIDFGVAKAQSNTVKTQAGMVKGKVLYFSPEQLNGQPLDGRSDLFAVGLILYELVCGLHPLRGNSDIETIFNYVNRTIAPPLDLRPDLPPVVSALVMRSLARDRDQRFPNADLMGRAVADALFQVYPSYQRYLLRDFLGWALDEPDQAPYLIPAAKRSDHLSPSTPPPIPPSTPERSPRRTPPPATPWPTPPIRGEPAPTLAPSIRSA